jgi:hypothetical protein
VAKLFHGLREARACLQRDVLDLEHDIRTTWLVAADEQIGPHSGAYRVIGLHMLSASFEYRCQ